MGKVRRERTEQTSNRILMAEEKQGPSKFYGIAGGLDGFNGVAVDWCVNPA